MSGARVWVLAEVRHGQPTATSAELLAWARDLADGDVTALVLGTNVASAAEDLVALGADRVRVMADPRLEPYVADAWLPEVARLVGAARPTAVLLGHGSIGADLAPRLAFRLDGGVATDCVAAETAGDRLLFTRPCHGGKAMEVVSFPGVLAVATMRPKSRPPAARDKSRSGEVVAETCRLADDAVRTTVRERIVPAGEDVPLESASVVVAGGRGLNGDEGFSLAETLAGALGGVLGASRAACDLGWCSHARQIGLSGKKVAPELYVALGISGAPQHMSGCAGAKTIVAVNRDPNAPIFKYARFGVVGNCAMIVPALLKALRGN